MRKLAGAFARLLRQPTEGLPETLVFHAMAAGFHVNDPTTDPNAFFTYFLKSPAMQVKTQFVGLHAPAKITAKLYHELLKLDVIAEVYKAADELDIVVTSAGAWLCR